jgi:transcriptional regulator with XRE-family HTH domain
MSTTDQINKTIGTRIAALRHARGMTAAQVAELAAMSQWRLTRIENTRSEATAAELVKVGVALGVTSSVICGEERFSEFMDRVGAAQAEAGAR